MSNRFCLIVASSAALLSGMICAICLTGPPGDGYRALYRGAMAFFGESPYWPALVETGGWKWVSGVIFSAHAALAGWLGCSVIGWVRAAFRSLRGPRKPASPTE